MVSDKVAVTLVFASCFIGASTFYVKYAAMELKDEIKKTKLELAKYRRHCNILHAEYQALSSPERIQFLADKYLGNDMEPAKISNISVNRCCSAYNEEKIEQLSELIGNSNAE